MSDRSGVRQAGRLLVGFLGSRPLMAAAFVFLQVLRAALAGVGLVLLVPLLRRDHPALPLTSLWRLLATVGR